MAPKKVKPIISKSKDKEAAAKTKAAAKAKAKATAVAPDVVDADRVVDRKEMSSFVTSLKFKSIPRIRIAPKLKLFYLTIIS